MHNSSDTERHWDSVANAWRLWQPPLRPSSADIAEAERAIRDFSVHIDAEPFNVLMYGMTPELVTMACPPSTCFHATDRSIEMIRQVWPGNRVGKRMAVCSDWLAPPLAPGKMHVAIGDGPFNCCVYPEGWTHLAALTRNLLAPGGLLVTRLFALPERPDPVSEIHDDLMSGRIASFHVFKFRLGMALQPSPAEGVIMDDIWTAWSELDFDKVKLAAARGWSVDTIDTIAHYKGKQTRLIFPTLAGIKATLAADFEALHTFTPEYEMGERCPTLTFRARA